MSLGSSPIAIPFNPPLSSKPNWLTSYCNGRDVESVVFTISSTELPATSYPDPALTILNPKTPVLCVSDSVVG